MVDKLILQLKTGNLQAFNELLRRYYPLVEISIRRQLETRISAAQARSLARAVFARAHLYAGDLRHDEQLGSWLAGLTNRIVSEYLAAAEAAPDHQTDEESHTQDLPPW